TADVVVVPKSDEILLPATIINRQVPVITFRDVLYTPTNDQKYVDWQRLSHDANGGRTEWGSWVHTYGTLLPAEQYYATHPEYFALVGGNRVTTQPCLSNPAVLEIVCGNLAQQIAKNPKAKYWSVSSNDNFGYCQCPLCAKADSVDGSATGSVIQFTNKVAARFPDKIISTLAYQYSRAAPKVTIPAKNVNIMFCNIECNRSKPIATDPSSASFRQDMEQWAALTDNILVWDYVIQFKNLVSPFPNFHILQPNLKWFVENSVVALFEQGNREKGGEFAPLRSYLVSKLLWNPLANADSIITDFCNGYYGKGGPYIKQYIDELTSELIKSDSPLNIFGSPCDGAQSYLSAENLARYGELFDKAEAATASEAAVLERVKIARQPLLYAFLEQTKLDPYGPNGVYIQKGDSTWITNPHYTKVLNDFTALCQTEGVTRLSEWHTTPQEYLKIMSEVAVIRRQGLSFEKPITMSVVPHAKYSNGSDKLLTNGIMGTTDYHIQWLGWDAPELELTMDLGKEEQVKEFSLRCLQNLGDWIFLPTKVDFLVSIDGKSFSLVGSVEQTIDRTKMVTTKSYDIRASRKARYIKARVTSVGKCPVWHMGAGNAAFMFMDEFAVD
ncbi:MAG: DUF4838 domain-containing protein, partial [Mucinivorans sp.]